MMVMILISNDIMAVTIFVIMMIIMIRNFISLSGVLYINDFEINIYFYSARADVLHQAPTSGCNGIEDLPLKSTFGINI